MSDDFQPPDNAPAAKVPLWATVPSPLAKAIGTMRSIPVAEITKENLLGQLWIEAIDPGSDAKGAKVKALEIIARMKGWLGREMPESSDVVNEDIPMTDEQTRAVAAAFEQQTKQVADDFYKKY